MPKKKRPGWQELDPKHEVLVAEYGRLDKENKADSMKNWCFYAERDHLERINKVRIARMNQIIHLTGAKNLSAMWSFVEQLPEVLVPARKVV